MYNNNYSANSSNSYSVTPSTYSTSNSNQLRAKTQSTINNNNSHYENNNMSKLKCVFVGDALVGKTSLIVAYTTNGYPYHYTPTAFDNYSVTVWVDNKPVKLELADTSGQSKFDSLRTLSYGEADVFLLCFNVMVPGSLNSILVQWLPEISKVAPNVPLILVGTHSDQRTNMNTVMELSRKGEKPIDTGKASFLASQINAEYLECSALTQRCLKEVFDMAIVSAMSGKKNHQKNEKTASKINAKFQNVKNAFMEKQTSNSIKSGFRKFVNITKKVF
uniref:Rho GTPase n=1 Tax=Rhabditophanes sp. KR3021 TaxID=114890 RepID=A0AC35TGC9_9BILA